VTSEDGAPERNFAVVRFALLVPRPSVRLVPVSTLEYQDFVTSQIREFADQKIRAGHWRREEAQELSRHAVESFLPRDGPTKGHRVYRADDESGRQVGWIWIGPPPVRLLNLPDRQWLYQITVDSSVRGKGFGRAMLSSTEKLLSREGVKELYLNVFRWNSVARTLYDSAGYEVVHDSETETGMRKTLDKHAAR
jgi:GNAT superfamily N-acetyltransferase